MKNKILLFLIVIFCCSAIPAQEVRPVRLLLGGALEFGGDEVAEIFFIDGSTQSVNAGQGGSLFLGAQFQLPAVKPLFFRTSAGFKYVTTKAENVDIRLTRVPLHFTGHYVIADNFHVGGGLALHTGIRFKADGLGEDLGFKTASGPRVEAGWKGLALTYTNMKYTADNANTYDASNFGLSFSATIPK